MGNKYVICRGGKVTGLRVSEMFYSIQGEGPTAGMPAIFLRLQGCDFNCSWCDTIKIWKEGKLWEAPDLVAYFKKMGWTDLLKLGVHLVITGGNPLLQEKGIVEFYYALLNEIVDAPYIEVETQGSSHPSNSIVDQYNVSPKLSNSGVPDFKRIKEDVIRFHVNGPLSCFKFVVRNNDDVEEARYDFILPFQIKRCKIWLMPEASTREELIKVSPEVIELCKTYGYNFSNRLQLMVWNKTIGV